MTRERDSIDAILDLYRRDVDRTMIRENLKRTVEERIEQLVELQKAAEELRRAGRAMRGGK